MEGKQKKMFGGGNTNSRKYSGTKLKDSAQVDQPYRDSKY